MKMIGLIGGMSWESSAEYYRIINATVRERLGGLHSARSIMLSVDFAPLEEMQLHGRWSEAGDALAEAGRRLEAAGADFVVLCTNTMHKVAPAIEAALGVPFIHIADATAVRIQAAGIRRVGLLGTAYTMEQPFYKGRLQERFGLDVLIPPPADRAVVHRVIYEELVLGRVEPAARADYVRIIQDLVDRGAEGIILGCTEITLLIRPEHVPVPVFDTTRIHAETAVALALND